MYTELQTTWFHFIDHRLRFRRIYSVLCIHACVSGYMQIIAPCADIYVCMYLYTNTHMTYFSPVSYSHLDRITQHTCTCAKEREPLSHSKTKCAIFDDLMCKNYVFVSDWMLVFGRSMSGNLIAATLQANIFSKLGNLQELWECTISICISCIFYLILDWQCWFVQGSFSVFTSRKLSRDWHL